jgi:hypothetical protein
MEKLKQFPVRAGIREGYLFLLLFYFCSRNSSQRYQSRIRNKRHVIGKEEVKLSLYADDMILYIVNPITSNARLLN